MVEKINKLSSIPTGVPVELTYMYLYVCTNWRTGEKQYFICRNKREDEYTLEKDKYGRYVHDYQVLLDGSEIPRNNNLNTGIIGIGDYGYCLRSMAIYKEMDRLGLVGIVRDFTYYSNLDGPYKRPQRMRGIKLHIPESKWK